MSTGVAATAGCVSRKTIRSEHLRRVLTPRPAALYYTHHSAEEGLQGCITRPLNNVFSFCLSQKITYTFCEADDPKQTAEAHKNRRQVHSRLAHLVRLRKLPWNAYETMTNTAHFTMLAIYATINDNTHIPRPCTCGLRALT